MTTEELFKVFYEFYNSICPAYIRYQVPETVIKNKLPYLTYSITEPDRFDFDIQQVLIYSKSESQLELLTLVDVLKDKVKDGFIINGETGTVYITRGSPYIQFNPLSDETTNYKCVIFNFNIQVF